MNLDYSRYYENWHTNDEEHFNLMTEHYLVFLTKYLKSIPKDASILEIGSGMGFCINALNQLGYKNCIGIDLDDGQVEKCQEKKLNIIKSDANTYFKSLENKIDIILMFDVLEHIQKNKIIPLLKNINSNLALNGKFICQTPNCYSIAGSAYLHVDFTHELSFSPYSLDFVLYNSGFTQISIEDENPIPNLTLKFLIRHPVYSYKLLKRKFARGIYKFILSEEIGSLTNVPLSANIVAIAKK